MPSGRLEPRRDADASDQATSTSKVRRVDFGGCGPPQPKNSEGRQRFELLTPLLYPGIGRARDHFRIGLRANGEAAASMVPLSSAVPFPLTSDSYLVSDHDHDAGTL